MIRKRNIKKYILIAAVSIMMLGIVCASALWLILNSIVNDLTNQFAAIENLELNYSIDEDIDANNTFYYGETDATCTFPEIKYNGSAVIGTWYLYNKEDKSDSKSVDEILSMASSGGPTITVNNSYTYAEFVIGAENTGFLSLLNGTKFVVTSASLSAKMYTVAKMENFLCVHRNKNR